jgi:hypothetical protein
MELIILIAMAVVAGYLFSRSRYSKPVDKATDRVTDSTKQYADKAENWVQRQFGRSTNPNRLRSWAANEGAPHLPVDFKDWLSGLSEKDAQDFTRSLEQNFNSLKYDLNKLLDGSLDSSPALMQTYVEAVVIYSQAYRKAKEARTVAETVDEEPNSKDGKIKAEKTVSRRKTENPEPTEAATAT